MWNKLFKSKSKKTNTTTIKSKSFLCRSKNKNKDPNFEDQQQKCNPNAASTSSTTGRLRWNHNIMADNNYCKFLCVAYYDGLPIFIADDVHFRAQTICMSLALI